VSERVLEVIQAGVVPYADALAWQRDLAQARIERRIPHDLLLLLEHPRSSPSAAILRTRTCCGPPVWRCSRSNAAAT